MYLPTPLYLHPSRLPPASAYSPRPFIPKSRIPEIAQVGLHFRVNGTVKQSGTAQDMIFDVPHLISFVSSIMRLEVGLWLRTYANERVRVRVRVAPADTYSHRRAT